jgi:twitching motility protein PilI
MSDPFQRLQEIERLCSNSAELLPNLDSHEDDWTGIGFTLGDIELLSTMGDVTEILDPPEYTKVPGVKSWVVGIANVRGSLLPLIDLRSFVTGEKVQNIKKSRVLVVRHGGSSTGLVVDDVLGMRHFALSEQVYELPDVEVLLKPYITQAFQRDDKNWPVFSFNALVEDDRFLHASL